MGQRWWQVEVTSWWLRLLVGRRPTVTFVRLALVAGALIFVFKCVLQPIQVSGKSMEPTYRDGRRAILNTWAYRWHAPQRGDVVGIRVDGSIEWVVKRIVALPGENVGVRQGRVWINGQMQNEPFAVGSAVNRDPVRLGADEYFAIGDNRRITASGVVKRREILGRVWF